MTQAEIYSKVIQAIMTNSGPNLDKVPGETVIDRVANLAKAIVNEIVTQSYPRAEVEPIFMGFLLGALSNPNANYNLSDPQILKAFIADCLTNVRELKLKLHENKEKD